jgi:uncharacterized membrane protein YjjP (DUF1212 family)
MRELFLRILFGLGVYFLLTIPHFMAGFTMDNFGIIYPFWLVMLIAFVSGFIGSIIVNYLENK